MFRSITIEEGTTFTQSSEPALGFPPYMYRPMYKIVIGLET